MRKGPLRCPDRSCDPSKGDDGCMAELVNGGAHDALDIVWCSIWDKCPLIDAEDES